MDLFDNMGFRMIMGGLKHRGNSCETVVSLCYLFNM